MANPSQIDEEAASLRVLCEGWVDAWILCVGAHDRGAHVVEHDALNHATEEAPRRLESLAEPFHRLAERGPDELMTAHGKHDDQYPELPLPSLGRGGETHLTEVDLSFLTRGRIVDANPRRTLLPAELVMRVPAKRRVRDRHAFSDE
jgi:hypothetical protein